MIFKDIPTCILLSAKKVVKNAGKLRIRANSGKKF